jgi:hypothetical protein
LENAVNYFTTLNSINVSDHIEKKNGLSYLAWAYAWGELKSVYPKSFYTIYENDKGWNYFTDGRTCWVKTGVTLVDGDFSLEHIEDLPVMDFKNNSISFEKVTSFDVNKAIQRSLTKAAARHGVGLYIYAGEDLPEDEKDKAKDDKAKDEKVKPDKGQTPKTPIETTIAEIDKVAKSLPEKGFTKPVIGEVIQKACGTPNYKKIEDVEVAKKVLAELKKLGGEKE